MLSGSAGAIPIGSLVTIGGTEYHAADLPLLQRSLVTPIDQQCQRGNYWLVTDLRWVPAPHETATATPVPPNPKASQAPAVAFREWTRYNPPDPAPDVYGGGTPRAVVAFHGGFVAIGTVAAACCAEGDPSLDRGVVWTSSDGRTWRLHDGISTLAHASPAGLVTDGSRLVAFGSYAAPVSGGVGTSVPAVWVSDDGMTWTRAPDPAPTLVAGGPNGFLGAFPSPSTGGSGTVRFARSVDGLAWQQTSLTSVGIPIGLAVGPGGEAIAVGTVAGPSLGAGSIATDMVVWHSVDGRSWSPPEVVASSASPVSVAAGRDGFVVAVDLSLQTPSAVLSVSQVWRIPHGGQPVAAVIGLGDQDHVNAVFGAGDVFVATGDVADGNWNPKSMRWLSTDGGATFEPIADPSGLEPFSGQIDGLTATASGLLVVGRRPDNFGHPVPAVWLVRH